MRVDRFVRHHRGATLLVALAVTFALLGAVLRGPRLAVRRAQPLSAPGSEQTIASRTPSLEPCWAQAGSSPVPSGPPDVTLPCFLAGPAVDLAGLRGTPTLVNVWASWCGPCRQETPLLEAAHRREQGRVRFLGIDTRDNHDGAQDFLASFGVTYAQTFDSRGAVPSLLGSPGVPVTIIVDARGRITYRHFGALTDQGLRQALNKAA